MGCCLGDRRRPRNRVEECTAMATLTVASSTDFSGDTLSNITEIDFTNTAFATTATFASSQFDDVAILEYDADWQRLRFRHGGRGRWNFDLVLLARPHDRARPQRRRGAAHVSVLDEALHARTRLVWQQGGEKMIEPRTIVFGLDDQVVALHDNDRR